MWRRIGVTLERSRKEIDFLKILRKREAKERATFFVFLGFCSFEKRAEKSKNGQKHPKYALNDVSKVTLSAFMSNFFTSIEPLSMYLLRNVSVFGK